MAKSLPISATLSFFLPVRNTVIKTVGLAGAAATSVLEVFDGAIDSVLTASASAGGLGYVVGDILTLVAGENGSSDGRATVMVTVIDHSSASSSISSSPSRSLSSSPSASTSPSASLSPSSSVSASPSASLSPSSSVSSSPSASLSPSSSVSSSLSASLSPSSSVSSSISASPSPSGAGAGAVTTVQIITAGGGYTAGNVYATTGGTGTGATIRVLTISDVGTSVAKLQCTANTSAAPLSPYCGILTTKGISVRISGTGAKGHLVYE